MTPQEIRGRKKQLDQTLNAIEKEKDRIELAAVNARADLWRLQNLICTHPNQKIRGARKNEWQWRSCPDCELVWDYIYKL